MKDRDVRSVVVRKLHAEHKTDPTTRIVQEMGVWSGTVRIDIATINGELSGFELKSNRDNLERLPNQVKYYNLVFDKLTLVCGCKHIKNAKEVVPRWWGLIVAEEKQGSIVLENIRKPKLNKQLNPYLVAQLLWKDEAIRVLEQYELAKGFRSKPARAIHERLVQELPFNILKSEVRMALKIREAWLRKPIRHQ